MNAPVPADAVPTRRRRLAPFIALPVGVVMLLLVILLATRDPATDRLAKSPLVGKQAPPIEGVTLTNESFTLDRVRGEWVVVNFFGSWCTPCIQEHPELVSFQDGHRGARDATVVSVAFADSPTAARQFFEKRGGDWPVLVQDNWSVSHTSTPVASLTSYPETVCGDTRGALHRTVTSRLRAAAMDSSGAEGIARYPPLVSAALRRLR